MGVPWKLIGLAGVAGVAAGTGVAVARNRREHREYDAEELRERLHSRLAAIEDGADAAAGHADAAAGHADEAAPA
jgi:hypothetical protein